MKNYLDFKSLILNKFSCCILRTNFLRAIFMNIELINDAYKDIAVILITYCVS